MDTVLLMSSLDTRPRETLYAKSLVEHNGCKVILMDISMGSYTECGAEYSCIDVAREAGVPFEQISGRKGTAENMAFMVKGATQIAKRLYDQGLIDGIAGLGGASNTAAFSQIMRTLTFGFPKLILSSSAAMPAYAGAYYGYKDIAIFHSCLDINGLNEFVKDVIRRFAGMIAGVLHVEKMKQRVRGRDIALSEFQFVEACARKIVKILESKGLQVIPFHAQGVGDRIMDEMIGDGLFGGALDLVPAGLSEAIVGGNRSAGLDRLDKEMASGIPVVLTPSGFDLFSCGPYDRRFTDLLWSKKKIEKRKLYVQDQLRVQARINKQEMEVIGRAFSEKLNKAKGKVAVFVPLRGFSSLSIEGAPLYDPESDKALIKSLRKNLNRDVVQLVEMDCAYRDDVFAQAIAERFLGLINDNP
jgi:uncharacterized protein (UPF0261 family)